MYGGERQYLNDCCTPNNNDSDIYIQLLRAPCVRTLPSALPHTATRTTPTHSPADCHTLPQIHCLNAAIHCRTLPRASTAAHYRTHYCRTLLHTAAKCRTAAHSRAHCHTYIHAQVHCRTLPRSLREHTAVRTATNCHSHYCRRTVLAALPHTVAHTRNNTTINNNFNNIYKHSKA